MNKLKYLETGIQPVLDTEQTALVEQLLNKKFLGYLSFSLETPSSSKQLNNAKESRGESSTEKFKVETGHNKSQCQLRITLERSDRTLVYPLETIVLVEANDLEQVNDVERNKDIINALIDFQDAYWTEYFENDRDTFVPIDWSEHHYLGHKIFVRGSARNAFLEDEADKLLQEFGFGNHAMMPLGDEP